MKSPLFKVCGMRDPENIREVSDLGPDYMGFIFYDRSPRFVGADFVLPKLPESIRKVGVFVNEEPALLLYDAKSYGLDWVQLSGNESPETCDKIKSEGLGVIKVFHVGEGFDFSTTSAYESSADLFLFDTKTDQFGGSGQSFEWSVLRKYKGDKPFLLAGGLRADNISSALQLDHPLLHGFDFNSGVESQPGLKNLGKIAEVQRIIRETTQP